jgi:hypothetical protein
MKLEAIFLSAHREMMGEINSCYFKFPFSHQKQTGYGDDKISVFWNTNNAFIYIELSEF